MELTSPLTINNCLDHLGWLFNSQPLNFSWENGEMFVMRRTCKNTYKAQKDVYLGKKKRLMLLFMQHISQGCKGHQHIVCSTSEKI